MKVGLCMTNAEGDREDIRKKVTKRKKREEVPAG